MARSRSRQAAKRQARPAPSAPVPTIGTDPALRAPDGPVTITGPGPRRTRCVGSGMPSGDGSGLSHWTRPMHLKDPVAKDPRWSATAYTNRPA